MNSSKQITKNHWDKIGNEYSKVWANTGKTALSALETSYISSTISRYKPISVLDIGPGTGRILNIYIQAKSVQKIYGIDLSEHMANICRQRFQHEKKVQQIIHGDIEEPGQYTNIRFNMISAIRVLKYNVSWHNMITTFSTQLDINGILVCTMPNIHSVSAIWPDCVEYTTPRQFQTVLAKAGFHVLDMRGFSKLPDILHRHANSKLSLKILTGIERLLEKIVGPVFGARILFVTCQKHD